MILKLWKYSFAILFLFVVSCAQKEQLVQYKNNTQAVYSSNTEPNKVDSIVAPYRTSLEVEMNVVLGEATCSMSKARPEGSLGNFVADIIQNYATEYFKQYASSEFVITILNHGGLRAPINEGPILLRNIFELMPFDNEIVFVRVKQEKFEEVMAYLEQSGGEPIAGFRKGDAPFNGDFWIATSDYLASGGDKMTFFQEPLEYIQTGRLMRDEIETAVKKQGSICTKIDGRWH
jgi:2',3'-cyclic-nucleotide 2'-phosphodiesterase (5'-nucleotidase family)